MPRKQQPSPLTLDSPLSMLPGVGPAFEARLAARGLLCVEDLLLLLPRRYSDRRENTPWEALSSGEEVTVEGVVVRLSRPRGRRGRQLRLALAADSRQPPRLWCHWFRHAPPLGPGDKGQTLRVCGVVREEEGRLVMNHPELVVAGSPPVVAIYPALEGIPPRSLRRWIGRVLEEDLDLGECLPPPLLAELGFPGRSGALRQLHQRAPLDEPTSADLVQLAEKKHPAFERLVFEEYYLLGLVAAMRRRAWRGREARACPLPEGAQRRFAEGLPFVLTQQQGGVLEQIWRDMASPRPMLRLLQGDVGSGKTVVAFGACFAASFNGARAVLLAPTALLAHQHYATLAPLCRAMEISLGLVTGAETRGLGAGAALVVGTHALLGQEGDLQPLGLVVVDEEHRFGVRQREALGKAGEQVAHRLVMSATPIPRSLALALYGDLDTSLLLEGRAGRGAVETRRLPQGTVTAGSVAAAQLQERLAAGEQAFVVCPLRAPSAAVCAADVTTAFTRLRSLFPRYSAGLLHGGTDATEREALMSEFAAGRIQLLVATTVVEVGVDAPDAQVMVVEHADRFGLAQLHQLRGRVGRRRSGALCLLLAEPGEGKAAEERLAALERCGDGFTLADEDLRQRGPGELLGEKQSGMPPLRVGDLRREGDLALMERAQREARRALEEGPEQHGRGIQDALRAIERRWGGELCPRAAAIVMASSGGDR